MRNHAPAWLRLLVTMFAFTLIAAACVSTEDDEDGATETESSETTDETEDEAPAEEEEAPAEEEEAPAEEEEAPAEEEEAPAELTASFKGVTPETIQLGVTMLDFEALVASNLSTEGWGDQIAVTQALID